LLKGLFKYIVLIVLTCNIAGFSAAQDTSVVEYTDDTSGMYEDNEHKTFDPGQRTVRAEDWQYLSSDTAFSYANDREAEKKLDEKQSNWLEKALTSLFKFLASGSGKFIFWVLIFLVLGYVIYKIFKGDMQLVFGRKEKDRTEEQTEIVAPEDLLDIDWEAKMHRALHQRDLRLATRFAFVSILQLLHQKQHIYYQPNTTNFEYYFSLKNDVLKQLFRQLLLRYEYAWFGKLEVNDKKWQEIYLIYQQLKSKL